MSFHITHRNINFPKSSLNSYGLRTCHFKLRNLQLDDDSFAEPLAFKGAKVEIIEKNTFNGNSCFFQL